MHVHESNLRRGKSVVGPKLPPTGFVAVGAVLSGWGVGQYPWLLVDHVTIAQAVGATATLEALLVAADAFFLSRRDQLADLAGRRALPTIYPVREHAEALASLGREYLAAEGGIGSIEGFLGFLATALRHDDVAGSDALELLTFHAAKGLEWETVWITGLEQGFVPIKFAEEIGRAHV